jgi:hypothetical protein
VRFKDVKRMKIRKYENNDTKKIKNVKKEKRKNGIKKIIV